MLATLRFIDRFVFRLWWNSLISQTVLIVAASIPALAFFYYFKPIPLFHGKHFFSELITSSFHDMIPSIKNIVMELEVDILGILLLLLSWLYLSFSFAGFFGTIRSAVVERKVSIKHYFSYGFFYFLPFSCLFLILISLFLIIAISFWMILLHASSSWPILLPVIAMIYLFYFLVTSYIVAVIFVDQKNLLRGIREGLRISFRSMGKALSSFFIALMIGVLGLMIITLISLLPFAVLQLFPDQTLTFITGSILGILLLLLFSPFPLILFTSTLFYRYVEVVKRKQEITSTTLASATS